MRFLNDTVGSAIHWVERQPPLELALSVVAVAAIVYVVYLMADAPT
jgi:hypothetical protein